MTETDELILRRSLDAVDRHRKWVTMGIVLMCGALVWAFVRASDAFHGGSSSRVLHEVMLILMAWGAILTLVIVAQITVIAKRILRAIELGLRR